MDTSSVETKPSVLDGGLADCCADGAGTVGGGDRGHVGDCDRFGSRRGCGGLMAAISGAKMTSKSIDRRYKRPRTGERTGKGVGASLGERH